MSFAKTLLLSLVMLALAADCALAGQGKGGKRRRMKDGDGKEDRNAMNFERSLGEAVQSSSQDQIPVMAVIRRNLVADDQKLVDKLASWPQLIQMSEEAFVAVKIGAESDEGKELIKRLGLKTLPAIAWLDPHGNPIMGQPIPDSVQPIQAVIAGWPSTMSRIQKYFQEHESRGEKFLARGKLREAYLEYSFSSGFKGPEAERAKAGKLKVKERWKQLLDYTVTLPPDSSSRDAIVKGLRRDSLGTDYGPQMELAIQKVSKPAEVPESAAPAVAAATPAEAKPAPVVVASEEKNLTELIASSARLSSTIDRESVEDTSVDTRVLKAGSDERMKEADKLLQEGLVDYRKATADTSDRGPARNELLKSAHAKFEKSLNLLEQSAGDKPDAQIQKLMEKTSMLMYGTLKYQSL